MKQINQEDRRLLRQITLENVPSRRDVGVRVVESLPWLMVEYYDLAWLHCNVGPADR